MEEYGIDLIDAGSAARSAAPTWRFAPALWAISALLTIMQVTDAMNEIKHNDSQPAATQRSLHIATNGNDQATGAPAAPFATLERARDEIRRLRKEHGDRLGPVEVVLAAGAYRLARPFELTEEDSGRPGAPVTYRAEPGAAVRLSGGRVVTGFQPVKDPAVLARFDPAARGKVCQADLKAQGIADYGAAGGGGLELFFNDRPMQIARWPNEGFVRIKDVLDLKPVDVRGTKGDLAGKFYYDGDRPQRWAEEKDLWLHGYWFWDWSDSRQKVESIDLDKQIITLAEPQHGYGYRKGQWYYAFNALSEINQPGEWCLDRSAGILYFWPPEPIAAGSAVVSLLPALVNLKNVSHVTLRGLILEGARALAVNVSGGTGNLVAACVIRNGGAGVSIKDATASGVQGCDIYDLAKEGVILKGGDRGTLTPAGLYADNNHIHHIARWQRMYCCAVHVSGVGNRVTHNLLDNLPHTAIIFGGNDHLFEFNEIHSVCYEANDAGAIYAGRDWTMRGTTVRYNYLHDITGFENKWCIGVYNDDMLCGTIMFGNVFYKVRHATFIGGGRDCVIENNIFVDCNPAVHVDDRALGWAYEHADGWIKEGREKGTLSGIAYNKPPYSERYPQLPGILDENPKAPLGNRVARNICVGGTWNDLPYTVWKMVAFQDNLTNQAPRFVDPRRLNFQLREDSPAYKLGFQKIPIGRIGLYQAGDRASWPVTSRVRPP
jgi:hypothetical protein